MIAACKGLQLVVVARTTDQTTAWLGVENVRTPASPVQRIGLPRDKLPPLASLTCLVTGVLNAATSSAKHLLSVSGCDSPVRACQGVCSDSVAAGVSQKSVATEDQRRYDTVQAGAECSHSLLQLVSGHGNLGIATEPC